MCDGSVYASVGLVRCRFAVRRASPPRATAASPHRVRFPAVDLLLTELLDPAADLLFDRHILRALYGCEERGKLPLLLREEREPLLLHGDELIHQVGHVLLVGPVAGRDLRTQRLPDLRFLLYEGPALALVLPVGHGELAELLVREMEPLPNDGTEPLAKPLLELRVLVELRMLTGRVAVRELARARGSLRRQRSRRSER